jgi:hypothetical protein
LSEERQEEVSPLVGGISLSAYVTKGEQIYLYAGTLGMVTYDDKILSNAHVIAMNPETADFLDIRNNRRPAWKLSTEADYQTTGWGHSRIIRAILTLVTGARKLC